MIFRNGTACDAPPLPFPNKMNLNPSISKYVHVGVLLVTCFSVDAAEKILAGAAAAPGARTLFLEDRHVFQGKKT